MAQRNSNMVQSLLKGLDILSTVADSENGLRLTDIADRLNLKPPTAHNLIQTLVSRGFLERVPGSRYRVGAAFLEVSRRSASAAFMRRAEEILQELSREFSTSTVTLAQIRGDEIRFRLRLSPDRPGLMQRPVGQIFQPYANASGLTCLAFACDDSLITLRERYPFHEFAAHLWDSPQSLDRFLARVRQRGYAVPPFAGQEALRVAAPIFDRHGALLGTLGLSTPWDEVQLHGGEAAVAALVTAAARRLWE